MIGKENINILFSIRKVRITKNIIEIRLNIPQEVEEEILAFPIEIEEAIRNKWAVAASDTSTDSKFLSAYWPHSSALLALRPSPRRLSPPLYRPPSALPFSILPGEGSGSEDTACPMFLVSTKCKKS